VIYKPTIQQREPLPVPRQIPAPPKDFIGRIEEIVDLLAGFKGGATITGLRGMGGIGKTALALVLAEKLASRFPDGQLFLELRGTSEKPLTSAEAMAQVIRAYHPEAKLPEGEPEIAGLYRSVLAGKRALLLLDNAASREQVEPLLPPSGSAVIITSRNKFALPGLEEKDLDVLPLKDAKKLLLEIAGRIGSRAEELARLCGCLPIALRNAAYALAERKNLGVDEYLIRLKDSRKRLELVEASFSLSYDLLSLELQRLWCMLSVFPADFDRTGAADVWKMDSDPAAEALSDLFKLSLVEYQEATGRYHLYDLARDFAASRLEAAAQAEAEQRLAQHFKEVLSVANAFFQQGGDGVLAGLELFDLEEANIMAGQAWAAERIHSSSTAADLCSAYPAAGAYVLDLRLHPRQRISWLEKGVEAARLTKDKASEGAHLSNLGLAYAALGDARKAIEYYEQHLAIAREIGDRRGEGNAMNNLGLAYADLGDARKAIEYYEQALAIAREIGDRRGEGIALGNLGNAYAALGDARKAIEYYEQHLAIAREIGDRRGEGAALGNLGIAYRNLGDARKAIEYYEQHLAIAREIGDRRGEGNALGNLGLAYADLGETRKAIEYYEQALAIDREIGDRMGEGADLGNLGLAYAALGETHKAIEYYEQHLAIAREIGDRKGEGNAMNNLGLAYADLGDARKAIEYYEQVLAIAREIGYRRGEGAALGNLGLAYADLGETHKAIEYYEQALAILREIGYRSGEGTVLNNLGNAYADLGETRKAIQYYEQALAIDREIGDRKGEGNALFNMSLTLDKLGQRAEAVKSAEDALWILQQIEDPRAERVKRTLAGWKG
jgi:tetratricopeptide (TPR) repeat protein